MLDTDFCNTNLFTKGEERIRNMRIFRFSSYFFILVCPFGLFAQDVDLIRQILPDSGGGKTKNIAEENKTFSISETQKKLLRKVLDTLSDREVDEYLRHMGLSTAGSIYVKRKRLAVAVTPPDEKPPELPLAPDDKGKNPPIVIENASEGEMLQVDKTKSGVLVLRGNVRLKVGNGTLTAETISVDSKRQEVYAEGGITYQDGAALIKGDKFIFDAKLQRGVVYDTKASFYPAYFIGKKIKKLDEKRYLLEMGYFTACNAEVPHYTFRAGKIVVYQDESVVATNLRLQIGGTTLFWFPMYYTSNLGSGWVTQAGKNQSQGWFLQNSYQWSTPTSVTSLWAPVGYKAKLDYYEKTGQATGIDLWRISPSVNYLFEFGLANYKRYQVTSAFDDRFRHGGIGASAVSNQVDRGELYAYNKNGIAVTTGQLGYPARDVGVQNETWWKGRFIANTKSANTEKDGTRNVQVKYENYSNSSYEYEFGNRFEPNNTLRAIYNRRNQRMGLVRQNLDWNLSYSEVRGDLSVNVAMKRNLNFNLLVPRDRSGYFPTVDQVPLTTIKNSSEVGRLPYFETPVYWDVLLTNSITRYYGPPSQTPLRNNLIPDGTSNIQNWVYLGTTDPYGKYQAALNRTQILTMGETGFRTTMNFGSYATFNPSVNYGARKENADFPSSVSADAKLSQDRLLKRNSYQYINNNHNFRIGAPVLFLNVTYRKVEAYKSELPDQVVGKNRVNEGEFSLESYAFQDFEFSVRTIRDLRNFASDYNPQPTQKQRWYYTVARASGFFDFIEGFGNKKASLLERQRSFYAGIFVNNDFVYHTALGKSLSNNFTVAFQMGGFSLPFIRNFKNFEMGTTWYHVYTSPILDNYRFYIQTDMQVTKNFGVELELDSRVTQPWRYTDQMAQQGAYTSGQTSLQTPNNVYQPTGTVYQPTSFGQDVATGLGANGLQARQTTAFNINRFMFTAKLNLHNWEYRLGYSMDLRALPGGSSFDNQLTFYDQSVFFSINLININLGGDDSQQQQGSRSRLYRFRKRPLEVGERSSVSSQAQ